MKLFFRNSPFSNLKTSLVFAFFFILHSALFIGVAHAQPDLGLQYGEQTGLGARDIRIVIASIINIVLGFLGTFFIVLLIIAGIRYFTALGNTENTKKAIGTITSAVIGLAIVLSAYAIARLVLQSLLSATTGIAN